MCQRSMALIPGLLRSINQLQGVVAQNRVETRRLLFLFSWVFFIYTTYNGGMTLSHINFLRFPNIDF